MINRCIIFLLFSFRTGAVDVVKALVAYYANINIFDENTGKTPLHIAACLKRGTKCRHFRDLAFKVF